jgi:phosphatidyl-myo-inositol dimannoside synthase
MSTVHSGEIPAYLVLSELLSPTRGGTAVWFDKVYRVLGGGTHIVTARVPEWEDTDRAYPLPIHRLRLERLWYLRPESLGMYLRLFSAALRLSLRYPFNSIHAGRVLPEGLAGLAIARLLRLPMVVYAHGEEITTWRQPAKRRVMQGVYRQADVVIANSGFTRGLLLELSVDPSRVHVIHPGVDLEVFRPGLDTRVLRQRFGLSKKRVILTVGRPNLRKGFDMVIRALPLVLREVSDAHYVIVGDSENQEYLKVLAAQMAVSDHVTFVGKASEEDLPLWYNLCELFAMPNRKVGEDTEGFGMVFIEANACGKPVLAGIEGGTGSAVIHGQTGLRVDGTKVEDVEQGILAILRSPELMSRLGQAGLARAQESFSWEKVAARTREVMADLGRQRPSGKQ